MTTDQARIEALERELAAMTKIVKLQAEQIKKTKGGKTMILHHNWNVVPLWQIHLLMERLQRQGYEVSLDGDKHAIVYHQPVIRDELAQWV